MARKLIALSVGVASLAMAFHASAIDLIGVYQQALRSAPSLKADQATSEANEESGPIALSQMLPQVTASATTSASALNASGDSSNSGTFTTQTYKVSASQNVFNINALANTASGYDTTSAARYTYRSQEQQFMLTVSNRYFAVLEAQDNVKYANSRVLFLDQTLKQTEDKYKVGLSTITDVKQAEANYDQAVADQIKFDNQLSDAYEQLAELTGRIYTQLSALKSTFPFEAPMPDDIHDWVQQAVAENNALQSARETASASRNDAIATAGNQLPEVSVIGSYTHTAYGGDVPPAISIYNHQNDAQVGLQLSWNVFSGGALFASTVQSAYQYASQSAQALETYRSTVNQTSQDYRSVIADVAQVAALKQSVLSNTDALKQDEARYRVGVGTIVEVLNSQKLLFESQQKYAQARYQYLTDALSLKLDAGTLNVNDLQRINQYLGSAINMSAS